MSKKRTGINTLAYMGVEPEQPVNYVTSQEAPDPEDVAGFNLGDMWLDRSQQNVYMLVAKSGGLGTWLLLTGGSGTTIQFNTDSGNVTPAAGIINVSGGANINTAGAGNTITVNVDDAIYLPATTGSTVGVYGIDSKRFIHAFGANNTFVGSDAGNFTLTGVDNTFVGDQAGISLTTGTDNVGVGISALTSLTSGNGNTAIGANVLADNDGADNIAIGSDAGSSYTGSESDNILIGSPGVLGEDNVLRIGVDGTASGEIDQAFIAGIWQRSPAGATENVVIDANGELGTVGAGAAISQLDGDSGSATGNIVTIAGGTNITTSAAGSTVTIDADGSLADTYAADSGTATPSSGTITFAGGTDITTSAAGSTVTIDLAGSAGFTWNEITGTSATMSPDNGYIANNAGLVTLTLPSTIALGEKVRVAGFGAGGWQINQNAAQTIHFGSSNTTTGVAGSLASTNRYDAVDLLCVADNTDFVVLSSVGNITVT